jgi:hypothetical protein
MHNCTIKFLLIIIFSIQFFSCKKDRDTKAPEITVHSPFSNQSFSVYDNIPVSIEITDETKITEATMTLVDVNFIPAGPSVSFSVTSPKMSVNSHYLVDNIHLESGIYYLLFTATDGENNSKVYRAVNIGAVPKKLKKIFVASGNSSSTTNLSYIDSSFSAINFYHSFSGDYIGTSASSYYQQVFMAGNYTGAYTSMMLNDNSVKFIVPASISSSPYYTSYYSEDKKNYLGFYDERIRGYDNFGNPIYSANANAGYYVRKMIMSNGALIAEEKLKTSSTKILVSFYSTGAPQFQTAITQDVVAFCEQKPDNVFVFGNVAGQGVIQLYERSINNLRNPYNYTLPTGTILSAVKIDLDTYLIGYSNGTIYKYQYQSSSLTTYLTGYNAIQLKYDSLNNGIYIAETNRIINIDYPSKALINSINSAEPIFDIALLYNR